MDLSVLVTQPAKNPGVTIRNNTTKHIAMPVKDKTIHPSSLKYQREAGPIPLETQEAIAIA